MRGYKSPASRLARLFKKSRDSWKERAIHRQKQTRALRVKVNDLTESRDRWKEKAKESQRELDQSKAAEKLGLGEKGGVVSRALEGTILPAGSEEIALSAPARHHYPVYVIQLGIQQIVQGLNSLRGSQRTFELFGQFFAVPSPSFSSIRSWLFRLGLYQLQRESEYRSDWIMILDLTIELGQAKCLVILGVPATDLVETGYALRHQSVEVLALEVLTHSSGEIIAQKLLDLSEQVGTPVQILADHGSDVKKGVELYQQKKSEVLYTYDVTHQMALLLKKELENDSRWQAFVSQCSLSRKQIQQTELYFLVPPKQRQKARYLNVEPYVHWAQQILRYQEQGDFSRISSVFTLDEQTISVLQEQLDEKTLGQLSVMERQEYSTQKRFIRSLSQHIEPIVLAQKEAIICQAADVGRRRFQEKLGWLTQYKEDVTTYAQMIEIVHRVEKQVKQEGLQRASSAIFEKNIETVSLRPRGQQLKAQVVEYLEREGRKIPEGQTLLATSDIIESIFGKYKLFSSERSLKEMGKIVLTIPVFTSNITSDLVKKAMESVRDIDVAEWSNQVFGQSMLSKRRAVFNQLKTTHKLHEVPP